MKKKPSKYDRCANCKDWKTNRCWENKYNNRNAGPDDWCVQHKHIVRDTQGELELDGDVNAGVTG